MKSDMSPVSPIAHPRGGSFDSQDSTHDAMPEDKKELAHMAMGLRRMKRKLFLMHVEDQITPKDNLRDILWKAANMDSASSNLSYPSPPASPVSKTRAILTKGAATP